MSKRRKLMMSSNMMKQGSKGKKNKVRQISKRKNGMMKRKMMMSSIMMKQGSMMSRCNTVRKGSHMMMNGNKVRKGNMMNRCNTVRKGSLMKKKGSMMNRCSTVRRVALKNKCKRTFKASMKKLKTVARMMRKVTRAESQ